MVNGGPLSLAVVRWWYEATLPTLLEIDALLVVLCK